MTATTSSPGELKGEYCFNKNHPQVVLSRSIVLPYIKNMIALELEKGQKSN